MHLQRWKHLKCNQKDERRNPGNGSHQEQQQQQQQSPDRPRKEGHAHRLVLSEGILNFSLKASADENGVFNLGTTLKTGK